MALGMTGLFWVIGGSIGDSLERIAYASPPYNKWTVIPNEAKRNEESPLT
ncbi:MAG: hypothetical protein ABSA76_12225 [Bacteroidales bacterium]